MEEEIQGRLRKMMSQLKCDNDFRCVKVGFRNLCSAKVIGDGQLVDCTKCDHGSCLRGDPEKCGRRTPFGFGHFCTCPLRVFAAQYPDAMT